MFKKKKNQAPQQPKKGILVEETLETNPEEEKEKKKRSDTQKGVEMRKCGRKSKGRSSGPMYGREESTRQKGRGKGCMRTSVASVNGLGLEPEDEGRDFC